MHYCSICLIVHGDHAYIREWIEYYLLIGVDHFYITDNRSNPPLRDVLQDYIKRGVVTYRYDTRVSPQRLVYNECLQEHKKDSKWIAYFDSDEFLLLKKHRTIKEFLKEYENFGSVSIAWLCFGSNGHIEKQPSIINAYTTRVEVSTYYKTIIQPTRVKSMNVHNVGKHEQGYYTVDEEKRVVRGERTNHQSFQIAQLNHYVLRSLKDYQDKMARGSAAGNPPRTMFLFDVVNEKATIPDYELINRIKELKGTA